MPRIKDEILDSVFYLYPSIEAAQSGESAGGTGFLIGISSVTQPEAWVHIYAVTNSHVVREGKSPFIRFNTIQGGAGIWHLKGMEWIHHPDADDVAVCLIPFISPEFSRQSVFQEACCSPKKSLTNFLLALEMTCSLLDVL